MKIKEMLAKMLDEAGNTSIDIKKHENIIKIVKEDNLNQLVTLKDKIIELEESLYNEKQGRLYRSVIEVIEKPLIEQILKRTDGNQFKAARILGINRNTMRTKVKKLGIIPEMYKV